MSKPEPGDEPAFLLWVRRAERESPSRCAVCILYLVPHALRHMRIIRDSGGGSTPASSVVQWGVSPSWSAFLPWYLSPLRWHRQEWLPDV